MKIKIWGCRSLLPVPGKTTLKYGGNTTCIEVRLTNGSVIILSAGTGIRYCGKALTSEQTINEIFLILPHSNWDHIMGFPFFQPAYRSNMKIYVRGGPIAKQTVKNYLEREMEPPFFPLRFTQMKAEFDFTHGIPVIKKFGNADIYPIPLSHPNGGFGFRIEEKNRSLVFLPNNELHHEHAGGKSYGDYIHFCSNSDVLLHDSQYTIDEYKKREGSGHSSYADTIQLALDSKVKKVLLINHDPDHTDVDIDKIVDVCGRLLMKKGSRLSCDAAIEGSGFEI